jgi:hypothetical protein
MVGGMANEERQTFPGLYVGTVLEVNQESASEKERALMHLGWIKVNIFELSNAASEPFAWARPCFPYGHFFVPKAGDRVWIAFEAGNCENPVWLGIWYPQDTVPLLPDETAPEPVQRLIRSESGHVLLFDDTETEEKAPNIKMNSVGGHSLSFDDTKDAETITLSHSGGDKAAKITLTPQTFEIELAPHTITLDNDGKTVEIRHSDDKKGKIVLSDSQVVMNFGDKATVTLQDSSITLTADKSEITLGSDGIALTFSSSTIKLGNDGTTIEGQPIKLNP